MSDMINFSVAMLGAVADFLGSPPMIYIVGLLLFCAIIKLFLGIFALNK